MLSIHKHLKELYLYADEIHLSEAGHKAIAEAIQGQ